MVEKANADYKVKKSGDDNSKKQLSPVYVTGKMKDGGVRIKAYNGPTGKDIELVIPEQIDGKPVKAIGKEVFKKMQFARIELPDTVEIIEKNAFDQINCDFIKLSSNLKELGTNAFALHGFSFIGIPESVEVIKMGAFDSQVAVIRGNPKLSFNNTVYEYYSDGENIKKHVGEIETYAVELHSLDELDNKYDEYTNYAVRVTDADGRVVKL